jgi:mannose/cellobiose epimerase-like protein (N-acyl-D-glucosamine 2-epimerase family)
MKRRDFISLTSAGAASLLAGTSGCGGPGEITIPLAASAQTLQAPLPTDEYVQAAFSPAELRQLRRQYEYDLYEDFLPFMEKFVIDHEHGGFMCTTDRDGTRISTDKSQWYEGRGIWVYSYLYNNLKREPKFLDVARKCVEFMLKHKPSGDGLWPSAFSREGNAIGAPDTRTYGDLFVAHGLAEYGRATGDDTCLKLAKETMLKCLRLYDHPDFWPEAAQSYLGKEAPLVPGARVQGVWFVLLNLATGMLDYQSDPDILAVADRCLDAIMNHHWNPDFELNNEILNHDLTRPQDDIAQFVYTGHAIETLWMVMAEAARRKDKALFELAANRFKHHVEVAWDDVYGGAFRSLNHVDKNFCLVDKVLWAQEEVLIGSLLAFEHTRWKWAKDWFIKMYNYVHDKWPLSKHGYSLWDNGTDRKVTYVEHYNRVENYHHPRHLMLNLLALDRLISRQGNPSGFPT